LCRTHLTISVSNVSPIADQAANAAQAWAAGPDQICGKKFSVSSNLARRPPRPSWRRLPNASRPRRARRRARSGGSRGCRRR
jgi:hypothetical protein